MIKKTVKLDGHDLEVEVRELTFGEVRDLIAISQVKAEEQNSDFMLDGMAGIGLWELGHFTSLTKEQIDMLPPSVLEIVIVVVREVNAAFFKQRDAVMAVASRMLSAT